MSGKIFFESHSSLNIDELFSFFNSEQLKKSSEEKTKEARRETISNTPLWQRIKDVERGMVLMVPNPTCSLHTKFKANVYILTEDEGGQNQPFLSGFEPQFYFSTGKSTGSVSFSPGIEMVMPGSWTELKIELSSSVAMEENVRFAIRKNERTIGTGTVSKILA